MNKALITNYLKTSAILKNIYTFIGSFLIRFIGLFIRQDDKMILFNSFGGKKYDDSPKALYECIKKDKRFSNYRCIWAFHNPAEFSPDGAEVIKTDGLKYFVTALKARTWITNSSIERGLKFKKRKTIYLNTWHGTPIKKMGCDKRNGARNNYYPFDLQNAQSEFEANAFSNAFGIPREKMLVVGLPRNDELARNKNVDRRVYKKKLNIPEGKKVILYAPTFRDYERDERRNCCFNAPMNLAEWRTELGEEYVVLIRCHYEIVKTLNIDSLDDFVMDVSGYPFLNDLMLASDILISDYSSIIFDYSILERPIVLFTYDYDMYNQNRGMYFDIREELPSSVSTEKELLQYIKKIDTDAEKAKVQLFQKKYVTAFGKASEKTVDALWEMIQSKSSKT